MRTDNGGEYMSKEFLTYCQEHRIQRQMTCPITPQQNGVVERKLAHLTVVCFSRLHDKNNCLRSYKQKLFHVPST